MKKSLYGIGFIVIFSIVTNLQIFGFYGFHTELNMVLNCNKTFYLWSVLIPTLLVRFLIPMILLIVTNFLTIRQVIYRSPVLLLFRNFNFWIRKYTMVRFVLTFDIVTIKNNMGWKPGQSSKFRTALTTKEPLTAFHGIKQERKKYFEKKNRKKCIFCLF